MTTEREQASLEGTLSSLQIKRASTAEQVAEALREMILAGELEQGQPLREVSLARLIGVSRNTIREAIRVLAREGIVTHQIHHGAIVTRLDRRDVEDIFRVRRVLELEALRATLHAGTEQMDGLAKAVGDVEAAAKAGDWGGIIDADERFHECLVGMLGSRRLSRFFNGIQAEVRLCMSIVDRAGADPDALVAEHRELLELIQRGDVERVVEVMAGHLAESELTLTELVEHREH